MIADKPNSAPSIGQIYRHYKGNLYLVTGFAKHSETLEDLVIYQSVSLAGNQVWARPVSMWNEIVDVDGLPTLRFTLKN